MLGKVEPAAFEPLHARHHGCRQYPVLGRRRLDLEVVPYGLPERLEFVDRPLPQRRVIFEVQATLVFELAHERAYLGAVDPRWRRLPEEIAFLQHGFLYQGSCRDSRIPLRSIQATTLSSGYCHRVNLRRLGILSPKLSRYTKDAH